MDNYKYKSIGVTVSGVIILSGWGDKQHALNNKAKDILEENKIEWFGSTDLCRYWITVKENDKLRAINVLNQNGFNL